MPIIRNLRKDFEEGRMDALRSISYEESGTRAPYVTKDPNNPPNNASLLLQANKRVDDVTRIATMLISKPGLKHLGNEALLKQTNISKKLQDGDGSLMKKVLRQVGGTVKYVAQVAASTLAQVPVNGTGTHFLKAFRTDTYLQDGDPSNGFTEFFGAGGVEGTKYALSGKAVPMQGIITDSETPKRNTTVTPGDLGIDHIGIKGNILSKTDISFFSNSLPYYGTATERNFISATRFGTIFPDVVGFKNTTLTPFSLGPGKDSTGAVNSLYEKVEYNSSLNVNATNPKITFIDSSTETNTAVVNRGAPVSSNKVQTTTIPGSFGRSNKGIQGDISGNSEESIVGVFSPIAAAKTRYTTTTTQQNIINTLVSKNISFKSSPNPSNNPSSFKYRPQFSTSKTYTGTTAEMNRLSITNGVQYSTDGAISVRQNSTFDVIGATSTRITSIPPSKVYDGKISSISNYKPLGYIEDFRSQGQTKGVPESKTTFTGREAATYALDYNDKLINKETRVGLGNQGKINRSRISYTTQDKDTRDLINYLDVQKTPLNGITENRDLIQLEFQVITPSDEYYLAFRALLDSFDDSFNASWSGTKYLGRADSFYTYGGFERTIQIGFKIAAATSEEMKPLYRKIATLASVTAPTYGEGGRFMRGSIAKVTVGDYIYEQPGIIESVQYTWQKDYPWEISFQNPEKKESSQVLPHVLDVSVNFKVIHDFLPETGVNPLITNHSPITSNKKTYIPLGGATDLVKPSTSREEREGRVVEDIAVDVTDDPVDNNTTENPAPIEPIDQVVEEQTNNEDSSAEEPVESRYTQQTTVNELTPFTIDQRPAVIIPFDIEAVKTELEENLNGSELGEEGDRIQVTDIKYTTEGSSVSATFKYAVPSLGISESTFADFYSNPSLIGLSQEELNEKVKIITTHHWLPILKRTLYKTIQRQNSRQGFDPINFKDNNKDGTVNSEDIKFIVNPEHPNALMLDPESIDTENTNRPPSPEQMNSSNFERLSKERRQAAIEEGKFRKDSATELGKILF